MVTSASSEDQLRNPKRRREKLPRDSANYPRHAKNHGPEPPAVSRKGLERPEREKARALDSESGKARRSKISRTREGRSQIVEARISGEKDTDLRPEGNLPKGGPAKPRPKVTLPKAGPLKAPPNGDPRKAPQATLEKTPASPLKGFWGSP